MPPEFPRLLKYLAAIFLLAAAAWYLHQGFFDIRSGMSQPSDFRHYYEAAQEISHRRTPYFETEYIYPPIVAFAALPFAAVTYVTARWIWFLASHLFLLAAALLIWRYLGRTLTAACLIAVVWAGCGAAKESIALGQIGPLLVLLLAVAFTQTGTPSGLAAGLGAALKFLPGAMLIPLALARDRRAVRALIVTAAILFALPSIALNLFFEGPKSPAGAAYILGTPAISSWSIPSTVLRALDPPIRDAPIPHNWEFGNSVASLTLPARDRIISAATSISVFLLGAAALAIAARWRISPINLPLAMAGTISLTLAAAPVCWSHYQILQYPGLALLLHHTVRRARWGSFVLLAACAAFIYPLPVAVLTAYYRQHGWTAASPALLYVWTSVPPLACIVIFVLALMELSPQSCEP